MVELVIAASVDVGAAFVAIVVAAALSAAAAIIVVVIVDVTAAAVTVTVGIVVAAAAAFSTFNHFFFKHLCDVFEIYNFVSKPFFFSSFPRATCAAP